MDTATIRGCQHAPNHPQPQQSHLMLDILHPRQRARLHTCKLNPPLKMFSRQRHNPTFQFKSSVEGVWYAVVRYHRVLSMWVGI